VAKQDIQLRDNTLESARQAANKYLEKILITAYYFRVLVYPHNVIRENKMVAGAGADRIQKGMRQSFGRATDRAARIHEGQAIFYIEASKANRDKIIEAYRRARSKLSGDFAIVEKTLVKRGG
jgi:large subunit ribosomal protein L10e